MRLSSREIGQAAEGRAWSFLKSKGFRLLAKNYATRAGELDLVVCRDTALVFVEVRLRSGQRFGSGAESVDRRKQQRLIRAAEHYLQHEVKHPENFKEFRFDVLSLGEGRKDIEWIQHAFTLD